MFISTCVNFSFIKKNYKFKSITLFGKLKMEKSKKSIRQCLLYEFQLCNNAFSATQNICSANGQGTVSYVTAKRWFKRFRNGDYTLRDDQRSGRPTEIDLIQLKDTLETESNQSTRNIANKLGRSQNGIHYQFKQLGLVPKQGKWVSHNLTPEQEKKRVKRLGSTCARGGNKK